jgi:hypothetical protein
VQAEVAIWRAYRAWEANPSRLRSLCGEVTKVVDRSVWDEALVAAGNSRMRRTSEAAYEFPPDLILTDDEEQDPAAALMEVVILSPAPPVEERRAAREGDSRTERASSTAGATVNSCAGQDAEGPDAQRQDAHDQRSGLASRPRP